MGANMKRTVYLSLAGMIVCAMFVPGLVAQDSTTQSQAAPAPAEPSLGSYARNVRKDKKDAGAKQFDNDNIPREDKLSVVGGAAANPTAEAAPDANANDTKQANAAAKMPTVTPGQTQEERQQVYDQWKDKLSTQQGQIDQLTHELDLTQREYKLRAAAMYGDAGERLRNQAQWDKDDTAYKKKIADDQKALDDAKQKLDDLQEDARKAGVPNSVREPDPGQQNQQPQQ